MPTTSYVRVATRASLAALVAIVCAAMLPVPAGAVIGAPPAAPTLLTPPPGWVFSYTAVQLFSVIASDPEGEPYTAVVTVRNADDGSIDRVFATHPSPSSVKSSGVPAPPLPPGRFTWSARAMDATGGVGPTSASSSFEVAPPPSAGAGVLVGTVTYDGGVSHGSCTATAFDLDATSVGVIANVSVVGFVGEVSVRGRGGSSCENATFGAGGLALALEGTGPTGSTLACATLDGGYTRAAVALVVDVTGSCLVNGFVAQHVRFTAALAFTPTDPGGGVFREFTEAAVLGPFAVVPG